MASLLRSRAGELENGTGLDGPGLVDCASHLAAEEAAHVAGDVDEPAQLDVGAQAASLQGVHQVLGAGVAPRHLRERAAAEAGHRRLEVPGPGPGAGVGWLGVSAGLRFRRPASRNVFTIVTTRSFGPGPS